MFYSRRWLQYCNVQPTITLFLWSILFPGARNKRRKGRNTIWRTSIITTFLYEYYDTYRNSLVTVWFFRTTNGILTHLCRIHVHDVISLKPRYAQLLSQDKCSLPFGIWVWLLQRSVAAFCSLALSLLGRLKRHSEWLSKRKKSENFILREEILISLLPLKEELFCKIKSVSWIWYNV